MRRLLLVSVLLTLTACAPDAPPAVEVSDAPTPSAEIPEWARVSPEQIAEAEKHGVPVAFENALGMRFVLVPAGMFMMGSPGTERRYAKLIGGRTFFLRSYSDERPQHRVALTRPFYMSLHETTNRQFLRHKPGRDSMFAMHGDSLPVVLVNRIEATEFAEWLTRLDEKRAYRLPTEAEWEYACRAGTTTPYSWGESESEAHLYVPVEDPDTSMQIGPGGFVWPRGDESRRTEPVGSYLPNPWGLYDMHGNAAEWCADLYGPYPDEDVEDPTGPASGGPHVIRGHTGLRSWSPAYARSASRHRSTDANRFRRCGFRLVSPLPEPGERGR